MKPELTRERALALAGVAGLLVIGLICLVMIASAFSGDDEPEFVAAPTATATATPEATPTPKPTPEPLTAAEKAARRAAADLVRSKGFEVVRLRDYDPRDKLRVLIGRGTAGGHMAFFFVDDLYIGNDRSSTSEELEVKRTRDTQTTLTYGEDTDVRFRWDGTRLVPQDPLPA